MVPPVKRRKTEPKVEAIDFDTSARQEYLTGFHKRKVQRTKQAQEAAEKRAREDKIAARKRIRDERKADLERHVKEVNALMRSAEADENTKEEDASDHAEDAGWEGIPDPSPPPIDHEAEYIDEDKYTTVTVETMDITRDGLAKLEQGSDHNSDEDKKSARPGLRDDNKKTTKTKSAVKKQRSSQSKENKRKRKDFKYESKTERKVSRMKERLKNNKQAKARKAG